MSDDPTKVTCAVLHTDGHGNVVPCPGYPHVPAAHGQNTGRRCPRCDCPDGHEQCDHCKVCPHARDEKASCK